MSRLWLCYTTRCQSLTSEQKTLNLCWINLSDLLVYMQNDVWHHFVLWWLYYEQRPMTLQINNLRTFGTDRRISTLLGVSDYCIKNNIWKSIMPINILINFLHMHKACMYLGLFFSSYSHLIPTSKHLWLHLFPLWREQSDYQQNKATKEWPFACINHQRHSCRNADSLPGFGSVWKCHRANHPKKIHLET